MLRIRLPALLNLLLPILYLTGLRTEAVPAPIPPGPDLPVQTAPLSEGPQAGQRIIFFGDATTQAGFDSASGFVHLVQQAFQGQNRPLMVIRPPPNANTAKDLLGRLQKSVLDSKPDWMTLSCGFYDATQNVPVAQFRANVDTIINQATAAGIKLVLMTTIMSGEDQANPLNQKLVAYNEALRQLARERNLPLADVNAGLQAAVTQARQKLALPKPGNLLMSDPVHLNGLGQELVAEALLKAFQCTDAQIAEARDLWLDLPGGMDLLPRLAISMRQYLQLRDVAAGKGMTVDELLNDTLEKDVVKMLIQPSPPARKPSGGKRTHARPHAQARTP